MYVRILNINIYIHLITPLTKKPNLSMIFLSPPFYFVPNKLNENSIKATRPTSRMPLRIGQSFLTIQNQWIQYLNSIRHQQTMQQFLFTIRFDSNTNNYLFSKLTAHENNPSFSLGKKKALKTNIAGTNQSVFCFTNKVKHTLLLMPFHNPNTNKRFEDIRDLANIPERSREGYWRKVMQLILVGMQLFRQHTRDPPQSCDVCVDGRAQQTLHIRLMRTAKV